MGMEFLIRNEAGEPVAGGSYGAGGWTWWSVATLGRRVSAESREAAHACALASVSA